LSFPEESGIVYRFNRRPGEALSTNRPASTDVEHDMTTEVKTGQWIKVRIVSRPKAAARVKTLMRLANQDLANQKARRRQSKSRPIGEHRRGGRMWKDRPPHLPVFEVKPGNTFKVFASLDVVKDLKSVADSVEVAPA
jgi:hypothetical protein